MKFSFHKDKDRILSNARKLAGTSYGISQDFPREIVNIRKGLIKVTKEAKKEGCQAKLNYDKLYIDGQRSERYRPSLIERYICSQISKRRLWNFARLPQEIVNIREGLIKVTKEAKKEGCQAKLNYDKLYIDGQRSERYRPSKRK